MDPRLNPRPLDVPPDDQDEMSAQDAGGGAVLGLALHGNGPGGSALTDGIGLAAAPLDAAADAGESVWEAIAEIIGAVLGGL